MDSAHNPEPRPANDAHTADRLLPLVYDELRRLAAAQLAREQPGQSLDSTALVHEAYIRLERSAEFAGKSHFFRIAAEAMRRILIDRARQRNAQKRGGGARKHELLEGDRIELPPSDTLLLIDEALTKLEVCDRQSAEVARLRLFAGTSMDEVAEILGISRATAFREWSFARAFLSTAIQSAENESVS